MGKTDCFVSYSHSPLTKVNLSATGTGEPQASGELIRHVLLMTPRHVEARTHAEGIHPRQSSQPSAESLDRQTAVALGYNAAK